MMKLESLKVSDRSALLPGSSFGLSRYQRRRRPRVSPVARDFPVGPLAATLAVQTLATAAAYSIPAVAPAVARDLGVNPALIGLYISTVYGVGILSALFSPRFIQSYGAVRASQAVLAATLAMLATAAAGSITAVALSAVLMGVAYGATAPASTHLLVPQTPRAHINLVLSLRQIGVPLAGMLAGLVMPPLTLHWGWQPALIAQMVPVLVLGVALEVVRRSWDSPHSNGLTPADRVARTASIACRQAGTAAALFCVVRLFGLAVVLHRLHDDAADNGCRHGPRAGRPCAGRLPNCGNRCASGLGLARRPCARRTLVARAAGCHHVRCGPARGTVRTGMARMACHPRVRMCWRYGQRVHRDRIWRIRASGRRAAHRGHGSGSGIDVRRRHGAARLDEPRGDGVGQLSPCVQRHRSACACIGRIAGVPAGETYTIKRRAARRTEGLINRRNPRARSGS